MTKYLNRYQKGERKFLKLFKEDTIRTSVLYKAGNISMYRDRLIKKGILVSSKRGEISIALPRFSKYVKKHS